MQDLIKDLGTLTTIPENALHRLSQQALYCICNMIEESRLEGEELTNINIGIGTLTIYADDEEIKCRFTPSSALESSIKALITEGKNPLVDILEQTLAKRIINTYKDLL